jgi:carboxypeptidase Q
MKIKLLCSALLVAGTMTAFAQNDTPDPTMTARIREEGMYHSQVMDIAFHLTDVSGPRLSGSPGLKRAQDWAVDQLKTWGMVNAKREDWGKFGKGWEIQKNYVAMTAPYYHALIGIPKAWTPGTNGAIKGEVVYFKADTITDLAKYKGKLKGKIIITDAAAPKEQNFDALPGRFTDAQLDTMAHATPAQGLAGGAPGLTGPIPGHMGATGAAGARGGGGARGGRGGFGGGRAAFAATLAQFELDEGVGLILAQARGTDGTVFTTNGASYADTAHMVTPTLETSSEDYQRILRLAKAGVPVTIEADIKTGFFTKDLDGYNVVAEIPGTDPNLKDQLVMLGGHFDSWHAATGGTDNAAGSAVMMEAMRILSRIGFKPRRTIRIALWSAEEEGELGSRGYVANHFGDIYTMTLKPEQSKVSAYYNIDNGSGKIRGVFLQQNAAAGPIFQQWLAPFKDLGATTVTIANTASTDHAALDAIGIPGFQFIQDPMDYMARTHHSNQDTYDKIVPDDMKQMATIVASFVYNTAQRNEMIPRKPLPAPTPARGARGGAGTAPATRPTGNN